MTLKGDNLHVFGWEGEEGEGGGEREIKREWEVVREK